MKKILILGCGLGSTTTVISRLAEKLNNEVVFVNNNELKEQLRQNNIEKIKNLSFTFTKTNNFDKPKSKFHK